MESILTLTVNPAIDKTTVIDHVVPDRKLRCATPTFEPGGGGLNVSRAIKKLGGSSKAIYFCGGPPGEILTYFLRHEEIDHQSLEIQNWTRENLVVYESATEQQFRFGMPGPDISEEEWRNVLDLVEKMTPPPKYLVASGSLSPGIPIDFFGRVSRIAVKKEIRLIVDTSGDALSAALGEGGLFLVKPNIGEIKGIIPDTENLDEDQIIDQAGKFVRDKKVSTMVISIGSGGSMLITKDGCNKLRAPTVPIKSKVGAGDSMVAGITLALAQGKSIKDAVRYGIASGASAVMTPGTELCRKDDTERLYEKMKKDIDIEY